MARLPRITLAMVVTAGLAAISQTFAQEPPVSPRTPMGPGSPVETFGGRDLGAYGMKPDYGMTLEPAMIPPTRPGSRRMIEPSDTQAIDRLQKGKLDAVILSKANAELIIQLYRPDQNQWQEYKVAPRALTDIKCEPCSGKLKFAFNNGAAQSELNIEAPSVLRIFADLTKNQWQWDSFRLVSANPPQ